MPEHIIRKKGEDGNVYKVRQTLDDTGIVVSETILGMDSPAPAESMLGSVDQFVKDAGMETAVENGVRVVKKVSPDFWNIMKILHLELPCDIPGCQELRKDYAKALEREKSRVGCPDEKQDCVERAVRRKFYPRAKVLWEKHSKS